MTRSRLVTIGAIVAVLAVIYALGLVTLPGHDTATGATAGITISMPVTSAERSCPPSAPGNGPQRIAMIAVRGGTAASGTGTATVSALGPGPARSVDTKSATEPGTATLVAPASQQPAAVAASGAMAEGLEAELATTAGTGMVACGRPAASTWFAGTGQQEGAPDIRLYLMNSDDLPASVNVSMFTDGGEVQGAALSGIIVPPHQAVTKAIAQYVRGSVVLGINVQTSSGRVASAVWEGPGKRGEAGSWLPAAAEPATHLVIPGLAAASSAARLFVVVPGGSDAKLKINALGQQGRSSPFGSTAVDAPASAASSFTLSSLGGSAAAIEVTSSVPVTAGVIVPGSGLGSATAAASPLQQRGIAAGNPVKSGMTTSVLLTAPDAAATARVEVFAPGLASSQVVTVRGAHTVAVPVKARGGGTFAVVVTPLSGGPLYGARLVTQGGAAVSIVPLASAPGTVSAPPVAGAYPAVMP